MDFDIDADKTLVFNRTFNQTGTITKKGAGILELTATPTAANGATADYDVQVGTLKLTNTTTEANIKSLAADAVLAGNGKAVVAAGSTGLAVTNQLKTFTGTVEVGDGETLTVNHGATSTAPGGFTKGSVNVTGGGTLVMTAKNAMGWYNKTHASYPGVDTITLGSTDADKLATLKLANNQCLVIALNLNGNTLITKTDDAATGTNIDTYACRGITVSGENNVNNIELQLRQALTITVNENGEYLHNASITTFNDGDWIGAFTKDGAGKMIIGSGCTSFVLDGGHGNHAFNVSAGTLELAAGVQQSNGTMTLNGGTLSLLGSGDTKSKAIVGSINDSSAVTGTGHLVLTNSGTISLGTQLSGFHGTLEIAAGSVSVGGTGSTLALADAITMGSNTGLSIGDDATINLTNWAYTRNADNTYSYTIVSSGAGSVTLGTGVSWMSGGLAVDGTYNSATGVYTTTAAIGRHVVNNNNGNSSFAWGRDDYYVTGDSSADDKNAVQFVGDSRVTLVSNITSENSVISSGASVTLAGESNNVTFTNLTNDGKIVLANSGRVNANSTFVEGKSGTLEVAWSGRIRDGFVNSFTGDVVVKSGAGVSTADYTVGKQSVTYNSLVVENGGHYAINGDLEVTEGITITGNGIANDNNRDTLGALKVGGSYTENGTVKAYTSKITGDVKIAGGSATICAWNGEGGLINGLLKGIDEQPSELVFINSNDGGNNHLIANSMENISTVEIERGTITLTSARDADGNADFTNVNGSATQVGDTFTKKGAGRLVLSSISSGAAGTDAVTVNVEAGELQIAGVMKAGTVHLGTGESQSTATGATFKQVAFGATSISGAKDETDPNNIKALGEVTSMKLTAAAEMNISDVTMKDVTITATGNTIHYLNRVTAIAASASVEPARSSGLVLSGDGEQTSSSTLTEIKAKPVQDGGTATGTLTVDVAYSLLDTNRGNSLEWVILQNVDYSDLTLQFGDVLTTLVNNGLPKVGLEVRDGNGDVLASKTIGATDIATPGYNLLTLEGFTGGNVVALTIANIPEPMTGVLSVFALAGLAARRRREKKN